MKQPYMPYRPCDVPKPIRFVCCRAPFHWTMAQITWIKTWYADMRDDDVCDALNLSKAGLYQYVKDTHLRKSREYKAWSLSKANEARFAQTSRALEDNKRHLSPIEIREKFNEDQDEIIKYYRDKHYKNGYDRCCDLALTYRKYDCSLEECQHIAGVLYASWYWGNPFDINSINNLILCNSQKNRQ